MGAEYMGLISRVSSRTYRGFLSLLKCLTPEKLSSKMRTCPKTCNKTPSMSLPRPSKNTTSKKISPPTKKEFDKKYNPTWHCIVGRNFGSYVTHETKHFIYFYLGQVAILLFKSG